MRSLSGAFRFDMQHHSQEGRRQPRKTVMGKGGWAKDRLPTTRILIRSQPQLRVKDHMGA